MAGKAAEEGREEGRGCHLALLPLPFQGHITPTLQLANILHRRGFSITILQSQNFPNRGSHPGFRFEPAYSVPTDNLTGKPESIIDRLSAINTNCERQLIDCLVRLRIENPLNPISCLIADAIMYCSQAVAEELGLPRIVLRTSSPLSFLAFAVFPLLRERDYLPIQDPESESPVPELPTLRAKDLPTFPASDQNSLCQFVEQTVHKTRTATALILNSSDHMEQAILPELRQHFPIPIFLVGPLSKSFSDDLSDSLLEQDRTCIEWLDKQAVGSVLYVSFGSVARTEGAQLFEMAWGLANSEQPFLWVVRPGSVKGLDMAGIPVMPGGFEEKVRGRGLIVKWAPQRQVLAHPAVGGFWTHCGWNSTLESICEGVPMLCWPRFGDQLVNTRLVTHVWKVGFELGGNGLRRDEIERAVRRLMAENEGQAIKDRIRVLKENADMCARNGGSSYESINNLVTHILSL